MVAGKTIDKPALEEFLRPAALIVAHNAAFDRPMCEKLWSGDSRAQTPGKFALQNEFAFSEEE
jgi:hypothetical protein